MHSFLRPNSHHESIGTLPIVTFMKNWTLPISILAGIAGYFLYVNIPVFDSTHTVVNSAISIIQPLLIFTMLFLTFLSVGPHDLHLRKWHFELLGIQLSAFGAVAAALVFIADECWRIIIESVMLCLLCPTATAAAVVTRKLDGSAADITAYTILINLAIAITAPALLPMAHPGAGMKFFPAFVLIIGKIFPLLICPLLLAWTIRKFAPGLKKRLTKFRDLPFYLWAVALALAIAVTVKAIVHSALPTIYMLGIVAASLICCILQFLVGKKIGSRYGQIIEGGQALGQKNTVFIIWLGYTFLSPVTAMAGGLYSVWHNLYNSRQLYEHRRDKESGA